MMRQPLSIIPLFLLLVASSVSEAEEAVRHELKVSVIPEKHYITVTDTVTLPEGIRETAFLLHRGLIHHLHTPSVNVIREDGIEGAYDRFRVVFPPGKNSFTVEYCGVIHHPIESTGREEARGFTGTRGIISGDGVFLAGASYWYPVFEGRLVSFTLSVTLPSGWDAVSQGERTLHKKALPGRALSSEKDGDGVATVVWESPEPQEEIYLIVGRFIEYSRDAGRVKAMVFLRSPDGALSKKYLDATGQYLKMYEELIGPYPYGKFALVENFWETGYGMPSFTLLGPKVIRLPFILHSSYPHEILHNWWGNSVYPDYRKGNWTEGLTAYLSDHLIKEQRGEAADYRMAMLQKYADYVLRERDFPLAEFVSRHSSASEAIGYGRFLMLFHMLRQEIGDEAFIRGLRGSYRENKFRLASFDDIRESFDKVSGRDLRWFFEQWVERKGAPELRVSGVGVEEVDGEYILSGRIEQVQAGDIYRFRLPFVVTLKGRDDAYHTMIDMDKRSHEFSLRLKERPLRLDVDPVYDVFRMLHRDETPPALTQAFGARRMLIILPSSAGSSKGAGTDEGMLKAYRVLTGMIGRSGPDEYEVRSDKEVKELPEDRAVTIVGWENSFIPEVVKALSGYDIEIKEDGVRIEKDYFDKKGHSIVLTGRNSQNGDHALTWIASDVPGAIPGLGRKLPHYHKYSFIVFEGEEPHNIIKGRWPVIDSPMTVAVSSTESVERGRLPERKPLIALPPLFSEERIMETIRYLASGEL